MNASKLVGVALCVALIIPSLARAEKDIPDAEIHAIGASWKHRCADLAVAENDPSLEKACLNGVRDGAKELDAMRDDPRVSDLAWDTCRMETGFGYTGDFHAWAACLRIAKTRPGLK